MSAPKFSPFLMEKPVPTPSKARQAGVILMFIGVQALFVAGSYYFPRFPGFGSSPSRLQQFHITIWVVLAANVLVFGVGALLGLRARRAAAALRGPN